MRLTFLCLLFLWTSSIQGKEVDLLKLDHWQLENVEAKVTEFKGQPCLNVRAKKQPRERGREHLAIIADSSFSDGSIELEVAGRPLESAANFARGFIGVAFRVQKESPNHYEAFYLRPTNGRSEDQLRRNHSVQYISHPDHTWNKLRKESPGKYESYADLVPGEWTKVKVVVKGTDARLYVGGAEQPCLIVKDLKHGESSGAIALWIEPTTDAYFRNLNVTKGTGEKLTSAQLVGTWTYTGGMKDGEELDADHFKGQTVVFTERELTLNSKTEQGDAKFVLDYDLDASRAPVGIELEITDSPFGAGATSSGIIALKNGNLTICYAPMGGPSPKEFKAEAGSGHYMFKLKRQ